MFEGYNKVQKTVLETTLQIIMKKELQSTSMSLISKKSGISTGNIYYYFKSKEDIINELYKAVTKECSDYVLNNFYDPTSIQERFYRAWENFIKFYKEHPDASQFIQRYSSSPYIYQSTKDEVTKDSWCGPLEILYAEAIKQNFFTEFDPHLMVQLNYGSVVFFLKEHLNEELSDDMIKVLISFCWKSVSKGK
ncbi:TetR/AcrR family transcriptional regulator [Paenibacillus donghaensis]|uniref:TetR family transcriptional regulator n=1 Tax=Paenibacillus donghaensis TaxID=414771 RepID=A0A2Z2KES1_9BACL|nr:TetR/AcrR family transcriptional regulator [Paenibacillus donghaensis]ASA21640.1 TetR family transcriptional regulator [Paenibacillus donghaensis]